MRVEKDSGVLTVNGDTPSPSRMRKMTRAPTKAPPVGAGAAALPPHRRHTARVARKRHGSVGWISTTTKATDAATPPMRLTRTSPRAERRAIGRARGRVRERRYVIITGVGRHHKKN